MATDSIKVPKKLIVCCDGTWMDSDNGYVKGKWGEPGHMQNPTNVTRISRAIASEDEDHHPQIVYYQAGIGTGLGLYNHILGGGTGLGLAENIREAYAFLASNYAEHDKFVPHDRIFLIGFSRGAFTARSLGGFICAMGILRKPAMPHFYDIFEDWENAGDGKEPRFFKSFFAHHPKDVDMNRQDEIKETMAELSANTVKVPAKEKGGARDQYLMEYFNYLLVLGLTQKVEISCIGVWDTVGALGIPINPLLQRLIPGLPSFLHRYKWFDTRLDNQIINAFHALALDERRFPYSPAVWERRESCNTNLKQVWFPGAHSNVGGSYDDSGSANITLAWMMDQLSGNTIEDETKPWKPGDWIKFDDDFVRDWYDCELDWLERNKVKPEYKGWGMGKLYDSLTPPQSWVGKKTRSPGCYHRTFYETGKTDGEHMLQDTNEMVHASVRARLDLGGHDVEPDWSQISFINWMPILTWLWNAITRRPTRTYKPQLPHNMFWSGPLEKWDLLDGHKSHKKPNMNFDMKPNGLKQTTWKYRGNERLAKHELPEDIFMKGGYEWKLIERQNQLAQQISFTSEGLHWVRTLKEGPRHGRTF